MMNEITFIGNLGNDPELSYTKNQKPILNFSVAVNRSWKDKEGNLKTKTIWHKCRRWGNVAEKNNSNLKKGMRVFIKGELSYDSWTDKEQNKRRDAVVEVDYLERFSGEIVKISHDEIPF
jgi:single-strand DNA-binding protein